MANITQLVRVLGCGSKSHRFKSCYSPLINCIICTIDQIFSKKVIKALREDLSIKIQLDV